MQILFHWHNLHTDIESTQHTASNFLLLNFITSWYLFGLALITLQRMLHQNSNSKKYNLYIAAGTQRLYLKIIRMIMLVPLYHWLQFFQRFYVHIHSKHSWLQLHRKSLLSKHPNSFRMLMLQVMSEAHGSDN